MKRKKIQITESDLSLMVETAIKRIVNESLAFTRDDIQELSEYLNDYSDECAKALLFSLGKENVWNILEASRNTFDETNAEQGAINTFINSLDKLSVRVYNEEEDYIEYECSMEIPEFSFEIDDLVLDLPENKFETPIGVYYIGPVTPEGDKDSFYLDGENLRKFTNFMHTHYPVNRKGIKQPDIDYDDYEEVE